MSYKSPIVTTVFILLFLAVPSLSQDAKILGFHKFLKNNGSMDLVTAVHEYVSGENICSSSRYPTLPNFILIRSLCSDGNVDDAITLLFSTPYEQKNEAEFVSTSSTYLATKLSSNTPVLVKLNYRAGHDNLAVIYGYITASSPADNFFLVYIPSQGMKFLRFAALRTYLERIYELKPTSSKKKKGEDDLDEGHFIWFDSKDYLMLKKKYPLLTYTGDFLPDLSLAGYADQNSFYAENEITSTYPVCKLSNGDLGYFSGPYGFGYCTVSNVGYSEMNNSISILIVNSHSYRWAPERSRRAPKAISDLCRVAMQSSFQIGSGSYNNCDVTQFGTFTRNTDYIEFLGSEGTPYGQNEKESKLTDFLQDLEEEYNRSIGKLSLYSAITMNGMPVVGYDLAEVDVILKRTKDKLLKFFKDQDSDASEVKEFAALSDYVDQYFPSIETYRSKATLVKKINKPADVPSNSFSSNTFSFFAPKTPAAYPQLDFYIFFEPVINLISAAVKGESAKLKVVDSKRYIPQITVQSIPDRAKVELKTSASLGPVTFTNGELQRVYRGIYTVTCYRQGYKTSIPIKLNLVDVPVRKITCRMTSQNSSQSICSAN